MKIYFVTTNERKIAESDERLKRFVARVQTQEQVRFEIEIYPFKKHLDELLVLDIREIVRQKALEAYRVVRLPCVVEHGGLFMDAWRPSEEKTGLLGGIGQIVWDAVGDGMCNFLRKEDGRGAEAQSALGYFAMASAFAPFAGSPRVKSRIVRGATEGFAGIRSSSRPAAT